ncbi:MAG: amino acid ABC transporter substrate-binding protein/permease [Bifidobacterium dentium]
MISDIETLFRSAWVRLCTLLMVIAVAVLGLAAAAPVAHAAEVGDPAATKGKTYKIGTDTTFAPFEYQEKGKMVGIDMELIQSIAKKEGFKIEIQASGFNAALQALSSNQVDLVIAGMSITDERKATYDFSDPYFQSGIQMAVAADNDDIKSYKDLDDKTVVAKTGSEGEAYAKEHAEEYGYTVTSVDQSSTMYEMVKSGNAVAVFDDYPVLAYGVSQHNGLKIVTPKVPHGEYGMAVNKGKNADLLAAIDDGLAQLISSGEYETIIAKYLGAEGAKAQVKAISGMVTDNDATATAKAKVGFLGLAKQSLPALMIGLKNTLFITVISFAIALLLGVAFGLMRVGENRVASGVSKVYVAIFRGTPILVWAFFFYFGVPQLIGHSVNIWIAGALTLSLNSGAYLAEIVRGAIQAVDPGQMEGARSLGLNRRQSMARVILPQASKIAMPSVINQLVIMIKDSSLLLAIGFGELLYQAQQLYAANFRVTETLLLVGVIYFVAITMLTWLANIVDRKVNR